MNGKRASARSNRELASYLEQLLARVETSLAALLRPGPFRPGRLHDLHRDLRRLRVVVDWRRRLTSSGDAVALGDLARRLRRLTRLAGRVRDLDVELALWQEYRPTAPGGRTRTRREFSTFGHRLQDDSRTGRELLKATLLAELHAGFFGRIRRSLSGVTSESATRALRRAIEDERQRLADRAARMRRRALRSPDSERMHQFRVLVRRLRYLSDFEDRLEGRRSSTFPPRYARILRRLGELHDRDVLAAHLDSVDPDHRFEAWSQRFQHDHQRLRQDLVAELTDLHPRRHLSRTPSHDT